jgi:hypothetical protein
MFEDDELDAIFLMSQSLITISKNKSKISKKNPKIPKVPKII